MTEDNVKNHPLRLITMEEAAEVLRIAPRTLRWHIARGEIAYVAVGSGQDRPRKLFTNDMLEAFIRRQGRIEHPPVMNPRRVPRITAEPPQRLLPAPQKQTPAKPKRPKKPADGPVIPRSQRKWKTGEPRNESDK